MMRFLTAANLTLAIMDPLPDDLTNLSKEELARLLTQERDARAVALRRAEVAEARIECANEAARIAGRAAQRSAATNSVAANTSFPWWVDSRNAFPAYAPYLALSCRIQALTANAFM
jgi:hypothetical protein